MLRRSLERQFLMPYFLEL